jgi:transcription elongation GreA/GreB family factor
MSVAFRRDCDEEHLEPKFELPIPAGPNLVTATGLALIRKRIADLTRDLDTAKDEAAVTALKRDLRYWQVRQFTAEVAPDPTGEKVEFGAKVHILLKGKPKCFWIVGDDEADHASGKISFKAPLSQVMLGAEPGETLPFGGSEDAIQVVRIEIP